MKYFILSLFLLLGNLLIAQVRPFKFGMANMVELKMTECDFYPDAKSMIIGTWGELRFEYERGFSYRLVITTRKKIFDPSEFNSSDIRIRYYSPVNSARGEEEITYVKGNTYNLVDGKIEKIKLENKEEFETRLNDYWVEKSIPMPKVLKGSVIEYKYEVYSPFLSNLHTWYFQDRIPVAYSEFNYIIPQYFNYQINQSGSLIHLDRTYNNRSEVFFYRWNRNSPRKINSQSTYQIAVARNVEPIIDEPFMNNWINLPSRLEFQLMTIHYPDEDRKIVARTYEKLNEDLLESTYLWGRVEKGKFASDFIDTLTDQSEKERASAIKDWIHEVVAWNNYHSYTSGIGGKKLLQEKTGNSGEINLAMIAAMREAGLKAFPVILSTRGHGTLNPVYPRVSAFNYVIGAVVIDDQMYFADGSQSHPFGTLPVKCLNGNGWLINEEGGKWVDLKSNAISNTTTMAQINVSEDQIEAQLNSKKTGYAGILTLEEYRKNGEKAPQNQIASNLEDWELSEFNMDDSKGSSVVANYKLVKENEEDILYLNPFFEGDIIKNPFNRETRYSNIDYPYRRSVRYIATVTVPENYICELPESINLSLPNGGGQYIYGARQNGNQISLMINYEMKRTTFAVEEYELVKRFLQVVTEKNNQLLVIKKS